MGRCVLEAGILRPNLALAQPAVASCSSGQDFSLTKGLGMAEIPLGAGSIIPQDKGWWDQLHHYQRMRGGRGTGILQALPEVSMCSHGMLCGVGSANHGGLRAWFGSLQQEGKINGFSKNPHHHLTVYSFIYMIFLLAVTDNGCAYHTPRVINNFSPSAIFLKH